MTSSELTELMRHSPCDPQDFPGSVISNIVKIYFFIIAILRITSFSLRYSLLEQPLVLLRKDPLGNW
jgi:hypothetical protein